jgi:hypothetical protein
MPSEPWEVKGTGKAGKAGKGLANGTDGTGAGVAEGETEEAGEAP